MCRIKNTFVWLMAKVYNYPTLKYCIFSETYNIVKYWYENKYLYCMYYNFSPCHFTIVQFLRLSVGLVLNHFFLISRMLNNANMKPYKVNNLNCRVKNPTIIYIIKLNKLILQHISLI